MTHKLMIVDDSKLARMAIVRVLDALHPDWSRVEAANADEALRLVREQVPEAAGVDHDVDGAEAAVRRSAAAEERAAVHGRDESLPGVDHAAARKGTCRAG